MVKPNVRVEPSALHLCARRFFSHQSRKNVVCSDLFVNFLGQLNLDLINRWTEAFFRDTLALFLARRPKQEFLGVMIKHKLFFSLKNQSSSIHVGVH